MTRTDAILAAIETILEDHRAFLDSPANVTSVQLTVKIKRGMVDTRASLFSAMCEGASNDNRKKLLDLVQPL